MGSVYKRMQEVLNSFKRDYDLSDMNANDELLLDNLARIFARLETIEVRIDKSDSVSDLDRLTRIAERLRGDASRIQNDLSITRRQRKGEKEEDLVTYITDIKIRAKKMLNERLSYVYCPKCKMLLATVWFLYPDEKRNAVRIKCGRVIDSDEGIICNHDFAVTSQELKENKNMNLFEGSEEILPT